MKKSRYHLILASIIAILLIPSIYVISVNSIKPNNPGPNNLGLLATENNEIQTASNSDYPVVLCPGWLGVGAGMVKIWNVLDEAGFNMIDFTGAYSPTADKTVNTKAITYSPTDSGWSYNDRNEDGIPESSGYTQIAGDKYKDTNNNDELVIAGDGIWDISEQITDYILDKVTFTAPGSDVLSPSETGDGTWHTPKINIITHSMGGLISRTILKRGLISGDNFEHVINLQAPHWGVPVADWGAGMPGIIQDIELGIINTFGPWGASAWDMQTDSQFMEWLSGYDFVHEVSDVPIQPNSWSTIAGHPWPNVFFSNFPANDMNEPQDFQNTGTTGPALDTDLTGFDGLVPQDGAWLIGSNTFICTDNHVTSMMGESTLNILLDILGSGYEFHGENVPLLGNAFVNIMGFSTTENLDGWPDYGGEPYYKIWIDPDGDAYTNDYISISDNIDSGIGDLDAGEAYRETDDTCQSDMFQLDDYETPFINIKIEVWDDDSMNSDDLWATFEVKGITLSSDIDQEDFEFVAEDSEGNKIWFEVNGFTNDVSKSNVAHVNVHLDNIKYNDNYESGGAEMYIKTWAGDGNHPKYYDRDDLGTKDDIDDGETAYWDVEMFDGYIKRDAPLKIRCEAWEDDSWSSDDDYPAFNWWCDDWSSYIGGQWGWWPSDAGDCEYQIWFTIELPEEDFTLT